MTEISLSKRFRKYLGRIAFAFRGSRIARDVRVGRFEVSFGEVSYEVRLELAREPAALVAGMDGIEFAETLGREKPDLPVVLATGYSQELVESGSAGRPVILKPYRLATLWTALTEAMRR